MEMVPLTTRNMYYGDPEKFDLAKMRADAYRYSRGDQFNEPQTVIIHYHNHEKPCSFEANADSTKDKHEVFAAVIGEEK